MSREPRYVARIARLPEVFARLEEYPDGVRLTDLAAELGIDPEELREDLLAYYTADPGDLLLGLRRPEVLEFVGREEDEEAGPERAEVVRISGEAEDLGVEHLDADELALIYTASTSLLEAEPDNVDLAEALEAITDTVFGSPVPGHAASPAWNAQLAPLREAVARQRRVDIVYSRAWHEGVTSRVIEPYRLYQTRRGWEVDAGPVDDHGRLRTFLLSGIRTARVTDEVFDPPSDLLRRLEEQRATTTVRMQLPHEARWAADMYAEYVELVEEDDETFTADLAMLPPVDRRVGLLTLAGGDLTRVLAPTSLLPAGPALARELLEHHGGAG